MTSPSLRRMLTTVAAATLVATAGCSGSALDDHPDSAAAALPIGMVAARTGVYKAVGDDMMHGFQLYLDQHGGKLGGRPVNLIVEDEQAGGEPARTAAQKLITADHVVALTGIVAGNSISAVKPLLDQYKVPLLGSNARPAVGTEKGQIPDLNWVWHTSYISTEPGEAMGAYVAAHAGGPVWIVCPDYQGGYDECGGFQKAFLAAGGKVANPDGKIAWTPFPSTTNFQPYLTAIRDSDAAAVYTFYAGGSAIDFVKQYAQFIGPKIPLYAAGFLTEGSVLAAQGDAAKGIRNSLNYSPDLSNPANSKFVADYQSKYGSLPTTFSMASFDAAAVLDKAIAAAARGEVTAASINDAIGAVGQIDSPRGVWQFSLKTHTPVQTWYLREVRMDGPVLNNMLVQELGTLGG
ncbi:ABC transporter substrate-binding protein [Hamadaea tsunoensis]|uniref:ABC transporter substrate-binding protein n=1 Tax=Hamadaea tsunoensis TaxID=53368 RepID=UPI00041D389B|nr:ABC transporter substrate-binding protein [Hamadaea tsunoensis]